MPNTTLRRAYALLGNTTPLKTDCGLLCNHACCREDPNAGGEVWLLPEEEALEYPWAQVLETTLPVTGVRAKAIACRGMCPREARPFCCRIFPLVPYYAQKRGRWDVRMDRRAWMVCPLCASGMRGLDPAFVEAARSAIRLLAETEAGERFLYALAREEAAYRISL